MYQVIDWAQIVTTPGYNQGVFSGIIENEDFRAAMGNPGDSLTGIIVSIYNSYSPHYLDPESHLAVSPSLRTHRRLVM